MILAASVDPKCSAARGDNGGLQIHSWSRVRPRLFGIQVVEPRRFRYRMARGNPFGQHTSAGLAYLPLGYSRQKRILK